MPPDNINLELRPFVLFPFFVVKLALDFDFCIRKNFIKTVRLKLLKKEEQVKNKLGMEYWNRIVYASVTDRD